VKIGVQGIYNYSKRLDSGFRRNDRKVYFQTFYETINSGMMGKENKKEINEEIQRERIEKALEQGYKRRKEESQSIAKEFEFLDLDGWDEEGCA